MSMATASQTTPFTQAVRSVVAPSAARLPRSAPRCEAQRTTESAAAQSTRRSALQLALIAAAAPLAITLPASADKGRGGFVPVKDAQDAYTFLYPFGWQEVTVDGQDVVYKDVIEPLESVSVSLVPTDKKTVEEFGDAKEVAFTLADKVLTSPEQTVTLVDAQPRETAGRKYVDFEFTAKTSRYTRHALASVTVGNGKFYTLVTGSNEKRWKKMEPKVRTVVRSFEVSDRYD